MVAEVQLMNSNFDAEILEKIIPHFVKVHESIPNYAADYEIKTRRKVYSTPKNYLDFLNCYISELENNKENYKTIIKGYHNGLQKLETSKASIEVMSIKIAEEKIKVGKRKDEVETLAREVKSNRTKAEEAQVKAIEKQALLEKQEIQIAIEEAKAKQLFEEKIPEFEAAKEKLKNIKRKDLTELKALQTVVNIIEWTCCCLLILKVNEKAKPPLTWS
jgi:dynein heavy chain